MCTIRRSKIKKLIKQQRKGKSKGDLFLIDIDALPVDKLHNWKEMFELINQKGVVFENHFPCVQKIRTARPRIL